jgi:hypothetical protein
MKHDLLLAVVLAATGCGADPLSFDMQSTAAWTQRQDAEARLRATADRAARFWGGAGVEDLRGWRVTVRDGTLVCGDHVDLGCAHFDLTWIALSAMAGEGWSTLCAEATLLAHEVGHAILWTPSHEDPRWVLLPAWQQTDMATRPDCL